jgi:replicative DNA helicase
MLQLTDQQLQIQVDRQLAEYEKIRNYDGDDRVISLQEAKDILDKEIKPQQFKVGLPTIDDMLQGFEPGELIIISGPSKNGKSSFARSLTMSFSGQGVPCFWLQFEETHRQFLNGFNETPPAVYIPKRITNNALLWVKSKILEAIIKYNTKIIFIDHLGFIVDLAQKQDRRLEMDTIVRFIKSLAVELEIVVFAMHHIRKIESGTFPSFEDLKESSSVYQDADKVLMIWREFTRARRGEPQQFTGDTILSIEMDRREGVYKQYIKLKYQDKKFMEISNMPYEEFQKTYGIN